ncbi:Gp49 family protein [Loigolactobacillus jiayinensis]|uniref:Gp49 family protein n=1 Tax=Loigolactobacillus jiayinensis TaxID=2486016 RepID=A0ABW1RFG7_9LACO|nr:Gp49 family protein [Loigolactobacillus jiayinensis]
MKNTITNADIEALMNRSEIKTETVFDKVTVVSLKLPSGFVITEASGSVDPANYDADMGKQICLDRITDKIWELEGYRLQAELHDKK